MATTTNYGWTTPDNTALVKDGASAIRTLGSSIDTSVKSLSPGTTAGDLDYYTSSTAKARIGIGTNGQVLTSNGSTPSWQTISAGGMTLISTTTLSGSSTTLSSIPQTYKDLVVVITASTASANYYLTIAPNNNTGASCQSGTRCASGSNGTVGQSFNYILTGLYDNLGSSDATNAFQMLIRNYTITNGRKTFTTSSIFRTNSGTTVAENTGGGIDTNSAISSLVFAPTSGTFSGGTVLLYGVS
jgi:hypothetical protein